MTKEQFRIVFMGTPDFAVAALAALYERHYNVVGVVTTADKKAGRGKALRQSAVKAYAMEKGIKVLTPLNLKDVDFLNDLASLKAHLQIVVAFRMLPEQVWNMPPYGTFNLHASLLPQYRGAAPINWAIINGETKTGVTSFFLDKKIDTGKIIQQETCQLQAEETAGELHDKLMRMGADLICSTVDLVIADKAFPVAQNDRAQNESLKSAPKIFKNDGLIDWNQTAQTVFNFIRGLSPYPAAWTYLNIHSQEKSPSLKIYAVKVDINEENKQAGEVVSDGKTYMKIKTQTNMLSVLELQLQGKKRMLVADFLRGFQLDKEHVYTVTPQPLY
ncbi:MAG: methionyl-tRNA formyltransferase [Bacteroidetes bacterium 4572_77]|nr:MAG: methionyl-tRNA formyltransferase [Bacteroidetes bacterium 4572_77]